MDRLQANQISLSGASSRYTPSKKMQLLSYKQS